MHFAYCPHCGRKTAEMQMGDDGAVPYCGDCQIPLFDMFSTCVLSVIRNRAGQIALIRQSYGQQTYFVGVAGYMKPGETAEEAAIRELHEEIGAAVLPEQIRFAFSRWHDPKGQLMLCFCADAEQAEFQCSQEVSEARWFSPEEALAAVRPGSIIEQLVQFAVSFG
ncbi:MAG: NUDIX domain-containing protein [Oscillospiraceae bacterium]|nr:NUDIX domain-containing protein [Oscillospiraceae bacterium]